MIERTRNRMSRIGRKPLVIGLALAAFSAAVALCAFAVYWFDLASPAFGAGGARPLATPAAWPSLPSPNVTHTGWSSFTFANTFRSLTFRDRFLFAATDGGVVAFDLANPNTVPVKFTTEHGLASNRVLSAVASPDGTLWFGTESGLSYFDGNNWTTYTTRDGLPSNLVRDLAFSADGLLWAATPNGLARFDGARWRGYSKTNTLFRLKSNDIRALAAAPNGLWLATAQGVVFFNGRQWTTFTFQNGLANDDTRDIALAPDGSIWVATRAGLSRFDGTNWTRLTTADGLLANELQAVAVSPDGSVWVSYGTAAQGLSHFDGVSWQTVTTSEGLPNDTVLSLAVASNGEIWAGTANGLSGFDGRSWRNLDGPSEIPSNDLRGLLAARGAVWAATDQGISRFDGSHWRLFNTADGLPSADVHALALGPEDTPWAAFGTPSLGAGHLGADSWESVPCLTAPPSANVLAGLAAADGSAWFATDKGLSRFDGNIWTTYTLRDGLPAETATALALAPDGSVWAATPAGLAVFQNGAWSTASPDIVRLMAFDPQGTLWAVTDDGLMRRAEDKLVSVEGAPTGRIRSLVARADGVWVATFAGIARLRDDGTWQRYITADGLVSDNVTTLATGDDGHLWAGYADASLDFSFFEDGRWHTYPEEIVDDAVTSIQVLDDGTVWLGTKGGVSRYDGDEWRSFTTDDGLPADEVNSLAFAYGTMWVATPAGVARFDGASHWQSFTRRDGLVSNHASELAVAPDGQLWVGFDHMGQGMSVYDGRAWHTAAGWDHDAILYTMTFSADGRLWASGRFDSPFVGGSTGFLAVHDGQTWAWRSILPDWPFGGNQLETAPDRRMWVAIDGNRGLQVLDVSADDLGREVAYYSESLYAYPLAIGNDGQVWASTNYRTKLLAFDGQDWTIEPIPLSAIVNTLALAPDGSLWVGTNRGAAHYVGGSWQTYRTAASLFGFAKGSVQALSVTPDGTLWFGTNTGSVKRYSPDHIRLSTYPAALTRSPATSIFSTADGGLWVTTAGSGIGRFDGTRWQVFTPDSLLGTTLVHALTINEEGTAWIGTTSGIVKLDGNNCSFNRSLRQRANVMAADTDAASGTWIGTRSTGAIEWGLDGEPLRYGQEFTGSLVTALDAAPDGSVWFAGEQAVFSFLNGQWQTYKVASDLIEGGIDAILWAPNRTLWIGTQHGASYLEGRRWQTLTPADGLADSAVQYILATPDGNLWFATPGGLSRYRP